jgi:two-component sensor histidine kinase
MEPEAAILELIQEPALVLEPSGEILLANRAAKRLLGSRITDWNLCDMAGDAAPQLRDFLNRCSGTSSQLIGSAVLEASDQTRKRFRVYGARLRDRDATVRIGLRLIPAADNEFSVLARKVRELNSEIQLRMRSEENLAESLRHNEVLLREIHHRVKNNLQTIMGLFTAAKREATSEDVREFLEMALGRLLAMGTAQQLMYEAQEIEAVSAKAFIKGLCNAMSDMFGKAITIDCDSSDGTLSSETAFPLALIVNELVTNSVKHSGGATVFVSLILAGGEWTLVVRDEGPGFVEDARERRSSGLGLIRGLCRQLRGSFTTENKGGAVVTVRFESGSPG